MNSKMQNLNERMLDQPYSLTQTRVQVEIKHRHHLLLQEQESGGAHFLSPDVLVVDELHHVAGLGEGRLLVPQQLRHDL